MSRGPEGRSRQPSSAHASRQSPDATRWSDGQVIITALISRTECRFSHRWLLHVLSPPLARSETSKPSVLGLGTTF
jgi:hypothetical protein